MLSKSTTALMVRRQFWLLKAPRVNLVLQYYRGVDLEYRVERLDAIVRHVTQSFPGTGLLFLHLCPTCVALYKVVQVEADPATSYGEITCRRCDGPLPGQIGGFLLKYFFVDRPRRADARIVAQLS